jgi:glycosyltransferase involved in cell wall biosynthesis
MRILHLATSKHGGAGIAAVRLHDALIAEGYDSSLITLEEVSRGESAGRIRHLLARKFYTLINKVNTRTGFISTSTFSEGSISVEGLAKYFPDVVHIHNWYNLLSNDAIADIASKYPTVITMHDERLITGSCHYSLDCRGYLTDCSSCPAVRTFHRSVSRNKRDLPKKISNSSRLIVMAPSQWLIDRYQVTALGRKISGTRVIPNIISVPGLPSFVRQAPTKNDEFNLLFAAVNPEAPTKGLDLLIEAVSNFAKSNSNVRIILHVVGREVVIKSKLTNLTFVIHGLQSASAMDVFFKKVDLVIVPSRIDNSPSIISEAQLNGALVLATNVGGIPELITDFVSGLVCEPNVESLTESLERAFNLENRGDLISAAYWQAAKRHHRGRIIQDHIVTYRELTTHE